MSKTERIKSEKSAGTAKASEYPSNSDIEKARNLARRVSPLMAQMFDAAETSESRNKRKA